MVKKKKRGFFDDIFDSLFEDFPDFLDSPVMSGAAGYSMEVHTTPEGTEVRVRVYGNVDKEALRKQIERMYPGAKIIIEGEGEEEEKKPLIRRIDEEKESDSENIQREKSKVSITFREGKPVIKSRSLGGEIKVVKVEKVDEKESLGKIRIEFKDGKPIIKKLKD